MLSIAWQQITRRIISEVIFYAVCHKNCYNPPLIGIVVFVKSVVTISLKTTPVMVGAVRSCYVF